MLGCGGVGDVWATWVGLRCGTVASTLFRQSCEVAKAMRFRRKLERIALDIFLSTCS